MKGATLSLSLAFAPEVEFWDLKQQEKNLNWICETQSILFSNIFVVRCVKRGGCEQTRTHGARTFVAGAMPTPTADILSQTYLGCCRVGLLLPPPLLLLKLQQAWKKRVLRPIIRLFIRSSVGVSTDSQPVRLNTGYVSVSDLFARLLIHLLEGD